jgi:hypothetical protein
MHDRSANLLGKLLVDLASAGQRPTRRASSSSRPLTADESAIIALAEGFMPIAFLPYFRRQIERWRRDRSHSAIAPALAAKPRVHGVVAPEWSKRSGRKAARSPRVNTEVHHA